MYWFESHNKSHEFREFEKEREKERKKRSCKYKIEACSRSFFSVRPVPVPSSLAVSVVLRTVQVTTGQESSGTVMTGSNSALADSPGHEFVSDSMRVSDTDLEEVREGMKKLGMQPPKG